MHRVRNYTGGRWVGGGGVVGRGGDRRLGCEGWPATGYAALINNRLRRMLTSSRASGHLNAGPPGAHGRPRPAVRACANCAGDRGTLVIDYKGPQALKYFTKSRATERGKRLPRRVSGKADAANPRRKGERSPIKGAARHDRALPFKSHGGLTGDTKGWRDPHPPCVLTELTCPRRAEAGRAGARLSPGLRPQLPDPR